MNASTNPFVSLPAPLILASVSPRRAAILAEIGIPFTVMVPAVSEEPDPGWGAAEHAVELALRKARAVAPRVDRGLVLGADTVVVVGGRILGKPGSADEAGAMLRLLSGRTHEVMTALALVERPGGRELADVARTRVRFRPLAEPEIAAYVASGDPMDKAGAYGIQGSIAAAVEGIEGCYLNVVGLPASLLAGLIARMTAARRQASS